MTGLSPASATDLTGAAAQGVTSLFQITPLVTVLVLIILALIWLVRYLIERNERQGEKVTDALVNNTAALTALKETVHVVFSQKG